MSTIITRWGNSTDAWIQPCMLKQSQYRPGGAVDFATNAPRNVELVEASHEHRKALAPGRATSAGLYAAHPIPQAPATKSVWPNDDFVGAEWDAWSR